MESLDIAISGGRIMDPDSGMNTISNIGISGGVIAEINPSPLEAEEIFDASGQIVCPGFIDLHCHPQDTQIFEVQALDGVTTTLELELSLIHI